MNINKVSGLSYYPNIIPKKEKEEILKYLQEHPEEEFHIKSDSGRKVRQYGYRYNYTNRNVEEKADPIPEVMSNLLKLIPFDTNLSFNQLIVNRYNPGEGISPHTDSFKFGPVIACFTIGGGIDIDFRLSDNFEKLYVEDGSLYIMKGDSRSKWTHAIAPRLYDKVNQIRIRRTLRYSLTFRHV